MKLYAHRPHNYEDRATHRIYQIPGGTWRDIPDEIGALLLEAHPSKLCDVSGEEEPGAHRCAKGEYQTEVLVTPPADTILRPRLSHQRRRKLKETQKRSRLARIATR